MSCFQMIPSESHGDMIGFLKCPYLNQIKTLPSYFSFLKILLLFLEILQFWET